jgi:prevent-host-death family protein
MRRVTADEAGEHLLELLREVENGAEVVITEDDRPVARLSPVAHAQLSGEERERAIREMVEAMRRGLPMGGRRFTRDEMYEDRASGCQEQREHRDAHDNGP